MMREVVELRDQNSKTFIRGHDKNGNAQLRKVICPIPIHYIQGGEVLDIKPEWDGLTLHGAPYSLSVDPNCVGFVYTIDNRDICASMNLSGPTTVEDHRLWWLDVMPDLDVCLIPSAESVALHFILHSDKAPRIFEVRYECDEGMAASPHRSVGRDNINNLVTRPDADMWRELEILCDISDGVIRTEWTGRVKKVDPVTRQRSWVKDYAYPVRIR